MLSEKATPTGDCKNTYYCMRGSVVIRRQGSSPLFKRNQRMFFLQTQVIRWKRKDVLSSGLSASGILSEVKLRRCVFSSQVDDQRTFDTTPFNSLAEVRPYKKQCFLVSC